jgi:hypothetical protein
MRHYFSSRPIAAGTVGMFLPTRSGPLIPSTRVPQALAAGLPGAAAGAVDLAAVATPADDHLAAATPAQEQTGRDRFVLPVVADAA